MKRAGCDHAAVLVAKLCARCSPFRLPPQLPALSGTRTASVAVPAAAVQILGASGEWSQTGNQDRTGGGRRVGAMLCAGARPPPGGFAMLEIANPAGVEHLNESGRCISFWFRIWRTISSP